MELGERDRRSDDAPRKRVLNSDQAGLEAGLRKSLMMQAVAASKQVYSWCSVVKRFFWHWKKDEPATGQGKRIAGDEDAKEQKGGKEVKGKGTRGGGDGKGEKGWNEFKGKGTRGGGAGAGPDFGNR